MKREKINYKFKEASEQKNETKYFTFFIYKYGKQFENGYCDKIVNGITDANFRDIKREIHFMSNPDMKSKSDS